VCMSIDTAQLAARSLLQLQQLGEQRSPRVLTGEAGRRGGRHGRGSMLASCPSRVCLPGGAREAACSDSPGQ
jgi:hypothetical protein